MNRYHQTHANLKNLLSPDSAVTIREFSKRSGASIGLISQWINGHKRIPIGRQDEIDKLIEEFQK